MLIRNGMKLDIAAPHIIDGEQFPAHSLSAWRTRWSELGITEVPDPIRPDNRLYSVVENEDGSYAATAKAVGEARALMVSQIKARAFALLAPTDWQIVRKVDLGIPCDEATQAFRASVRTACNANEALANSATTIADLASLSFVWPAEQS